MKTWINVEIKRQADTIREKLKREVNRLYGEPIDMDNPDAVLVAAVLMREAEIRQEAQRRFELLYEITKP